MKEMNRQRKLDFVKAVEEDIEVIVARHKRFVWLNNVDCDDYVYFIYITRKQLKFVDKKKTKINEYNVLCFNKMYTNYYDLMSSIYPILGEYLLDSKKMVRL